MQLTILFRNDHFVSVDKPAGWLSVPGRMGDRDPRPVAGRVLETDLAARVWPVHRLDEEATGLLLFALSARAHAAANAWFERRQVTKAYDAWTERGAHEPPAADRVQVWRSRLLRGKKRAYESEQGQPALTRATLEGPAPIAAASGAGFEGALAWRLVPETGRSHQLRFELARHGFPILGDELYGARLPFRPGEIALRSVQLGLAGADGARDFGLPPTLDAPPLS